MDKQQYEITGKLVGISETAGEKDGKQWLRATLEIENKDGKKKVATFDTNDIELARSLTNKVVLVKFKMNGSYSNLIKGGLSEAGNDAITKSNQTSFNVTDDKVKYRSIAVGYAKDLIIAGIFDKTQLIETADQLSHYILNGQKKAKPTLPVIEQTPEAVEEEVI